MLSHFLKLKVFIGPHETWIHLLWAIITLSLLFITVKNRRLESLGNGALIIKVNKTIKI